MKMTVSESTLSMLASAEGVASLAARLGVSALVALIEENISVSFKHGDAVQLASLLKAGGISQHSAKRYADITVMACKAIQLQATLASSKAKPADKAGIKAASMAANLAELAGMSDMRDIRAWSKNHGPKGEKTATAQAVEPTAQAIESVGQLREVRETLAMLNSGQLTQAEALSAIAEIVGLAIAKPVKPTAKPTAKPVKTGT